MQLTKNHKYKTPKQLAKKCVEYFEEAEKNKRPPTTNGLALFLGYKSRSSLTDNASHPLFGIIISKALAIIEMFHEEKLFSAKCTGSIFALKNMGWDDKTTIENINYDISFED